MPLGEAGRLLQGRVAGVDLALEAADHRFTDAAAVLVVEFHFAGEPHRIESLEEAGERSGVAVVGRGRQEEPMLEPRGDPLQHRRDVGVGAERCRSEVVGLVDDEQIPLKATIFTRLPSTTELFEHIRLLEVVVARDDPLVGSPWVCVQAKFAL